MENIEYRTQGTGTISLKDKIVEGHCILYNTMSLDLGGFKEIIKPGAVTMDLIKKSDILAVYDHRPERGLLARSMFGDGSLTLKPDNKGLFFSYQTPDTSLGQEVAESIRRRDIRGASFGFYCKEDQQTWEKQSDGSYIRTILRFELLTDVSPTPRPAYQETSVAVRSLQRIRSLKPDELKKLNERALRSVSQQRELTADELKDYYDKIYRDNPYLREVRDAELKRYFERLRRDLR